MSINHLQKFPIVTALAHTKVTLLAAAGAGVSSNALPTALERLNLPRTHFHVYI